VIDETTIQRIEHLKLQGFSVDQAASMQGVPVEEVRKVFSDLDKREQELTEQLHEIMSFIGKNNIQIKTVKNL
jgi:hypothetical protein